MADIRIGRVSRIDYSTGRIAVTYMDHDESVTDLLPFLSFGGEYHMPQIEQYVAVAHLSTGEEMGVVLGTFWDGIQMPAASGKDVYRKELSSVPSRAYFEHDPETGELIISADKIVLRTSAGTVTAAQIIDHMGEA